MSASLRIQVRDGLFVLWPQVPVKTLIQNRTACPLSGGGKSHLVTCVREAAGLRDPWGQDTDSLDRDVQGFLFTVPGAG